MDAATFRTDFPEFADATAYPDAAVNFQINLATLRMPEDRWQDLLPYGIELFTAHYLAVARKNIQTASAGGVPGGGMGVVNSKTVDKVSVSYDTALASLEGGGHWNLTSYGVQYLQLARMIGAGGIQL